MFAFFLQVTFVHGRLLGNGAKRIDGNILAQRPAPYQGEVFPTRRSANPCLHFATTAAECASARGHQPRERQAHTAALQPVRHQVSILPESMVRARQMLRVITERLGDRFRLDLHGTVGGEWVSVLEQHWRSILHERPSARVTVGLANVDFIDADGEALLGRMADDGVEFVVAGCMNRYVIDNLRPRVHALEGAGR